MKRPVVSIVIVNYNAGSYLTRCLDSVASQTFRDFEVIIVDNASRDHSLASAERYPWVKVVRNPENRGFAAGQNQGMQRAHGEYVMALNFDIHLTPDFLARMVAALDANPTVGTVSGKLLRMSPDGGLTEEIDNAGLLLSRRRMPQHRGGRETDRGQYETEVLVFGAMGAAALYRRAMLEDIAYAGQFFDESFFTWYEDIDLDWRGRLRGWDCLYVPKAVAYHAGDPQRNQLSHFAAETTICNRWQMILADDCLHCLIRDSRYLLVEELALLRFVVTTGRLTAYMRALMQVLWRLPRILAKRRWVRGRAIRSCFVEYPRPFGPGTEVISCAKMSSG